MSNARWDAASIALPMIAGSRFRASRNIRMGYRSELAKCSLHALLRLALGKYGMPGLVDADRERVRFRRRQKLVTEFGDFGGRERDPLFAQQLRDDLGDERLGSKDARDRLNNDVVSGRRRSQIHHAQCATKAGSRRRG